MANYKKLMIIGNVGREPETKHTPDGTQVTSFTMAVNEKGKKGAADTTTWFRVTAWRKQAELIAQYVKKGNQLFVMGDLSVREFVGQDQQTRTSLDVNLTDFQLIGNKEVAAAPVAPVFEEIDDSDIPF